MSESYPIRPLESEWEHVVETFIEAPELFENTLFPNEVIGPIRGKEIHETCRKLLV